MGFASDCESVRCVGWAEDIGHRDEMEDSFVFVDCFANMPNSSFLAVYDGHGGTQAVDFIKEELHENVLAFMKQGLTAADALHNAFAHTDQDMWKRGITTSGCTSCVCLLTSQGGEKKLHTAHLGDARAVIARAGVGIRLTSQSDHKATDPVEMQRVREAGGHIINDRVNGMLAIARAFGDHQLKRHVAGADFVSSRPDVTSTHITPNDLFLIIACDGLWDVIDDQEAVNLVLDGIRNLMLYNSVRPAPVEGQEEISKEELQKNERAMAEVCARMLVDEALSRGTSDNVTVMLTFF